MSIIISQNNQNAKRIEPRDFNLESDIQKYIYDNPNVIPLYEIKSDIRILIAAREYQTGSGPIDALGFDQDGNIYVVETKLYRNADKRRVVAQALDYGASLWRHSNDFDKFVNVLDYHTNKQFHTSFEDKISTFFSLTDASEIMLRIRDNLNAGNIKFVILMDKLHDQLKDLIIYINQNSQFDIYAVELEYYKHESFEIIIPKLFGNEVKKEVVSAKVTKNYSYQDINENDFMDYVKTNIQLSSAGRDALLLLHDLYKKILQETNGLHFYYYSEKANRAGFGVSNQDGQQTNLITSNGEFWAYTSPNKRGKLADLNHRVLLRLIDESICDKTTSNLTASAWSIRNLYFTNHEPRAEIDNQLQRFLKIIQEEA